MLYEFAYGANINTGADECVHTSTKVTDNFLNNCVCVMPRTTERVREAWMTCVIDWNGNYKSIHPLCFSILPLHLWLPRLQFVHYTRSTNETLLIHVVNCLPGCIATKFCAPVFLSLFYNVLAVFVTAVCVNSFFPLLTPIFSIGTLLLQSFITHMFVFMSLVKW